jgi:hypothetical protein
MVENKLDSSKEDLALTEFRSARKKRMVSSIVIAVVSGALLAIAFIASNTTTEIIAPGDPEYKSNQDF